MKLPRVRDLLSGSEELTRPAPPPDLQGRGRPDRAMTIVEAVADKYLRVLTAYDYDPASAGHNPDSALTLVVTDRTIVAEDENVAALTFAAVDGADLPAWQPGCHLDFHLPSGRRRQYSLCGDPADRRHYRIAVRSIPDGGGGSTEMHGLAPGTTVTVRGPRNGFPFVSDGSALFVAGGIGITPILPMVRAARRAGMDWRFVYSGRSRESMPFLDEIGTWEPDRVFVRPDDEFGLPTATDLLAGAPARGAVYCCGPTPMLDAVRGGFADSGATALHFERFGPPPVLGGVPFEVQLVSTGEVLEVPADDSALEVIRERLPDVGYSCRQGFCGTCKVRVLSGTPEHRERRLSPQERQDHMLICVSRADGGRLILDL
ncbi:PDR/VanB family oxidoreductase [Prescottella sp. R16]|uniref:PDR/VanB family oxidoreductase n=1 Tax=Prescottella sp. R16 TaxID=3064529 RepID=UPI00272E2CD4|nr:PDR/VanB family oxidoreductase [Prescottella sp. R16]